MSSRPLLRRLVPLAALVVLAGCGDPGGGDYPRLLPLSRLNAPPAVPAHAAEAAADPAAVESTLRARQAAARRQAPDSPASGDAALAARAAAMRARAGALAATDPAAATVPITETDPEAAARAKALRQRARDMLNPGAAGELPPCPPGVADPQAAGCAPD